MKKPKGLSLPVLRRLAILDVCLMLSEACAHAPCLTVGCSMAIAAASMSSALARTVLYSETAAWEHGLFGPQNTGSMRQ